MAMWRMKKVMEMTGLSKSTIYRMIAEGTFPPQRELGLRARAWDSEEVLQWLAGRPFADGSVQNRPTERDKSRDMSQTNDVEDGDSPSHPPKDVVIVKESGERVSALGESLRSLGLERVKAEVYTSEFHGQAAVGEPASTDAKRQAKSRKAAQENGLIEFSRRVCAEDKELLAGFIERRRQGMGRDDALEATRSNLYPLRVRPVFWGVLAGQIALTVAYLVPTVAGELIVRSWLVLVSGVVG